MLGLRTTTVRSAPRQVAKARGVTLLRVSRATLVVRGSVAALVFFLLAPIPLANHYPVDHTWYWAISWDHGFVRRGLCGEIAQRLSGDLADNAQVMTCITAAIAGATVLAIGLLLMTRGDPSGVGLGLALILSPVGVSMMWGDPRPEILGYPALPMLATAAQSSRGRGRAWAAVAGTLIAIVTLMSENVLLAIVPWAIVLLAVLTTDQTRAHRLHLLCWFAALPCASGLLVLLAGRANAAQVAALAADAARLPGDGSPFMVFLGQSFPQSVDYVAHSGLDWRFESLLSTAVALVIVGVAVAIAGGAREVRRMPRDRVVVSALALPAVAFVLQVVGGIDWPRWLGQQAAGALILVALVALVRPTRDAWTMQRVASVATATLVLVMMPAVPDLLLRGHLVTYWFSRFARLN